MPNLLPTNVVVNKNIHRYQDLIAIFNTTFMSKYNTCLVKGDDEPIYLPKSKTVLYNQIVFAHGYFASALHEIAHWCLAGAERRLVEDFGYWYIPDGRDQAQQLAFESVEIKPQAIEWALCVATGKPFDVSTDNLMGEGQSDRFAFKAKVYQQVLHYLQTGFPKDAQTLIIALAQHYDVTLPLRKKHFTYQIDIES